MKNLFAIVFISLFTIGCGSKKVTDEKVEEIQKAIETVDKAIEKTQSEEYQSKFQRLADADAQIKRLRLEIDGSNATSLISSKDEVGLICQSLRRIVSDSKSKLEELHGVDSNGEMKNRRERKYVHQLFLEEGRGKEIKNAFSKSFEQLIAISTEQKLDVIEEEFPIQLDLEYEKEGGLWEEHSFKDMPAQAVLPLIQKFLNDIKLGELIMLEELVKQAK